MLPINCMHFFCEQSKSLDKEPISKNFNLSYITTFITYDCSYISQHIYRQSWLCRSCYDNKLVQRHSIYKQQILKKKLTQQVYKIQLIKQKMNNIFRQDSPRKQAIHHLRPRSSSRDVKNINTSKQLSSNFMKDKKAILMEENDKLKDEIIKLVENNSKNRRGKERDQKIKVLMQNFIIKKSCLKIQMNKKYIEQYKVKSSKYQMLNEALLSIQRINKELVQAFPQVLSNQRQIAQQMGLKIEYPSYENQK